jgi:medium-chain acyl-[acyl-carrier-protein] hydrolase
VTSADWFVRLSGPAGEGRQVYALPQAGGGCATFSALAARLAPEAGVTALNLPGRQARFAEAPYTDLDAVLDGLVAEFPRSGRPVLFGYCSGALLAFLLAHRLRRRGLPGPSALIVSSYAAPHLVEPSRDLHLAGSDEFWAEILSYGGVPPQLATHRDFRRVFEPALRADYALLAAYEHEAAAPLKVPILALHGAHDPTLPASAVQAWQEHTTAALAVRALPGSHLLLDDALPETAQAVAEHLTVACVRPQADAE